MSVLTVLEQRGDSWNRVSFEALAAAAQIGRELGVPVEAAVLGERVAQACAEVACKGVRKVWAVEHDRLADYTPDAFTLALEDLLRRANPVLVVFPHTYQVRDYAPKLATRFGRVLVSDVIRHQVADGQLKLTRQLFQGKLSADTLATTAPPNFISVQAGAYRAGDEESPAGDVEVVRPEIPAEAVRTRPEAPFRESQRTVDLAAAPIIVSVGRGIKEKENLPLVEKLAQAMGAEIAASRPICDNGWLPMERQVGSSGQTVSPKLYVAVGISGAIQHLVGMKGSKTIVAINKDPDAPIFEVADYAIVGDLFEVVPALTEELEKLK